MSADGPASRGREAATPPAPGTRRRRAGGVGGGALAAGVPRRAGGAGGLGRVAPTPLPESHRDAGLEHRVSGGGGDAAVCRRRHAGGVVRRADRRAVPSGSRHRPGHPPRHPRLRRQLRLEGDLPLHRRVLGCGAGHDPGPLPLGLPSGRGEPARGGPGARGGGAQPRSRPGPDFLDGHGRTGPPGDLRRSDPGRPRRARRVRRVRDPGLPDIDHRDLQRVPGGLQRNRRPVHSHSFWCFSAHSCSRARTRCAGRPGVADRAPVRPGPSGRCRSAASVSSSLVGLAALVGLALGVPVGAIMYLLVRGGSSTLPAAASYRRRPSTRSGTPRPPASWRHWPPSRSRCCRCASRDGGS